MSTEKELLKGNTPSLVLAVLKDSPCHGYGIAREIERRTDNALKCKEGTLYPTLHSLERDGLIRGEWQRKAEGGERKVYAITPEGLIELERRVSAWKHFSAAIGRALEGDSDAGTRTSAVGTGNNGLAPEAA